MKYFCLNLCFLFFIFSSLLASIQVIEARTATNGTGFSFLRGLQGCHKGETVKGIKQLKQYMQVFGYLNSDQNSADDKFDAALELAIKTYQLNFHLSVTGTLDASTVEKMTTPRCGMPDIVNGTNEMLHHSNRHLLESVGLGVRVHYSFFPGSPRWSKYHLTYRFVNNFYEPTIRSVAASAFSKWASVSRFTFQLVSSTSFSDITIGGFYGNHNDGYSFDGPGGILAHAFSPTDGRLHMDSQENWSTNPTYQQMDIESVFIHEVGHILGLHHSQVGQAIMYATISYGVQKRNLHPDDVAGIQALYP